MCDDYRPCDYCGREAMTNIKLSSEPLTQATDTVYPSIPKKVVCKECAERISDYLEKKDENLEGSGLPTLPEGYVDEILDRIESEERGDLTLQTSGEGSGYRYYNGSWINAFLLLPDDTYSLRERDTETMKEILLSSSEVTIKRTDEEAWEKYLSDNKTLKERLLEDLKAMSEDHEGRITKKVIQEKSEYRPFNFTQRFGSISAALEEADINNPQNQTD
jgi:hypothetical protein